MVIMSLLFWTVTFEFHTFSVDWIVERCECDMSQYNYGLPKFKTKSVLCTFFQYKLMCIMSFNFYTDEDMFHAPRKPFPGLNPFEI